MSITSLGISFARLLTQGHKPVIKSILSFKFFKVLLMLMLKFILHSYILSMAVKSLMYRFVSKFQYFPNPEHDTEDYRKLEDKYWRGLCTPVYSGCRVDCWCRVSRYLFIVHTLRARAKPPKTNKPEGAAGHRNCNAHPIYFFVCTFFTKLLPKYLMSN